MFYILLCAIWTHFIPFYIDASCTFPSGLTGGTWLSSDKGSLSFTSTTLSSYPTTKFGSLDFTCNEYSGDYYVAKSTTFSYYGVDFEAYLCLRFTSYATYAFTYFLGSTEDAQANNERFKSAATTNGSALSLADVCDRTTYDVGTHSVLVKDGYISSAAVECPTILQSTYTYTYNDGSSTYCSSNSSLDVCTDKTELVFDYTKCSQQVLYSANGSLSCVYSETSGSNTYVNLYNNDQTVDGSSTYRYTCLVVTQSSTTRNITQYPLECTSSGGSLVLTVKASCPTTSTSPEEVSSATIAIALAVVVPLVLIVVTITICYFYYNKYQKKKDKEAAMPDPKYANGEIANKKLCPLHDGVTFASDANENLLKREDSVISNGIRIRREESIVISLPSSSRGGKRPMTEESIFEEPEKSINGEPGSDDDRYVVKDITELLPSARIQVPKIIINEATDESMIGSSEADGVDKEGKKIGRKKLNKKRKTSGKVRFKRTFSRKKSAKVRSIPVSASKDINSPGEEIVPEVKTALDVETTSVQNSSPNIVPVMETLSNKEITFEQESASNIADEEEHTSNITSPHVQESTSNTTSKVSRTMLKQETKHRIKSAITKRPGSVKSTTSKDDHQDKKGQGALSYGTKTLVLKLKQRNSAKKRKRAGEVKTMNTGTDNKSVAQIELKTKDDITIDIDSEVNPLDQNENEFIEHNTNTDNNTNRHNVDVQPNTEELLTERLEESDHRRDQINYETEGASSAKERRVSTLREEAYKSRPISEQAEKKRDLVNRRKTMPVLNSMRYVKSSTTPEEKAKISRAWSRTRSAKKGKANKLDNESSVRGMADDMNSVVGGPDEESAPDNNLENQNRGKNYKPKPFMEPRPDTPEDMWKKISGLWHLGFQWLGNTPLGTKPQYEK